MINKNINLPTHIGIIMDGNGRWATRRGLPRLAGHHEGVMAVKRTVDAAIELGIKVLTFFAFSTENWKRDKEEVNGIFELLRQFLKSEKDTYSKKNIKFTSIGDISKLPTDLQNEIIDITNSTKNNTGLVANVALNYGSKDEIINAVNNIIKDGYTSVDDSIFKKYLYTKDIPDPDLIIRTSGECRLSNFLLYQAAYSELYFPKVTWPDFNKRHLKKAIKVYSKRDRRFGGIKKK